MIAAAGALSLAPASVPVQPRGIERLPDGNTLITDRDNNWVIEVTPQREIVWSYSNLFVPHNGNRLANGNTLVSAGEQVVELTPAGSIVWQYPNTVPVPVDSEAFWQEREAVRFMKQVSAAYLRVQTEVDRNLRIGDNRHCVQ